MNLPQIKTWCEGLSLYKVRTSDGYGKEYYVVASDFNDAAEKVREYHIEKEEEKPKKNSTIGAIDWIGPSKIEVNINNIELLSNHIIL